MEQIISDITRWYDLQTCCHRQTRLLEQMEDQWKQSKWEHHEKSAAAVEFASTLTGMMDRLIHHGEKQEALRREEAHAKARTEQHHREFERQKLLADDSRTQCEGLPTVEELKARAQQHPDALVYFARREREYCAEILRPLLNQTLEALEDYRQQIRGGNSDRILSVQEIQEICGAHIAPAKECLPLLLRLREAMEILGKPMEIGAYFENPAGFVAAAARHNQLDKINAAISQVEASLKITQ